MADIVTAIVEVLKADAEITALVSDRVYGGELPADLAKTMPVNAIVVQASGGVPFAAAGKLDLDAQRFDLVCYGATPFEAAALRRQGGRVVMRIERQVSAGVLIHWVQSAGGFQAGRDRDGTWPYAFQSFQSLFALDEVA